MKTKVQPFEHSLALDLLLKNIAKIGGHTILVGGSVRDHLLGLVPKDLDLEVYGVDADLLEKGLSADFTTLAVGKAFGIYKVIVNTGGQSLTFDVAVPRRENKIGKGHKGFLIQTDPELDFRQASLRRDFTINSMGIDLTSGELLDPHNGQADLKNGLLKHVSAAFVEDPLRVFRAAQFCARFGFSLEQQTTELCKTLSSELKTLSCERIYQELYKLLLAQKPSMGLKVLEETTALELFPELQALVGCQQEPLWHPEGDVWVHTLMVCDEAAKLIANSELDEEEKLIVMTSALCHDLGKPLCSIEKDGRIKSPAHEQAGILPTQNLLKTMGFSKKLEPHICSLVSEHLKPFQLYAERDKISDAAIRRLCARTNIKLLLLVSQADFLGRSTKEALLGHDPSASWLKNKAEELLGKEVSPKPLIQGRHLISLNQKPGPHFAQILHQAFEAQLDGLFSNESEAMIWLEEYLKNNI